MYGVYVHVPWCRIRCPYCAFAVDISDSPPFEAYTAAVLRDWFHEQRYFEGKPETLSFGGGTPSRQPAVELAKLVSKIAPSGEVSLEANPEDINDERCAAWRDAGITRLSIGIQSFNASTAKQLGRAHSSRQATQAVHTAVNAGFRSVSLDLIFGLAGQTLGEWESDLTTAIDLGVAHLSAYGLSIEPETLFAKRKTPTAGDEAWHDLYAAALERLESAGLARYEVSNFARPGHRCVHNEHYWRARRWAGLGPAAHGWRPSGERTANAADTATWLAIGHAPATEKTEGAVLLRELCWSTLRHVDGIDRAAARAATGVEVRCPVTLVQGGLVTDDGMVIRLAGRGWSIADAVSERIWNHSVASIPALAGSY